MIPHERPTAGNSDKQPHDPSPKCWPLRIDEEFVIVRLDPAAPLPPELFAADAQLLSVTRTSSELPIVCPPALDPTGADTVGPWCAWYIDGPIPFNVTGVVQSVVSPISARAIPMFVVSTFDSDLILVPSAHAAGGRAARRRT